MQSFKKRARHRFAFAALTITLVVALGACQPLPRPFEETGVAENPLLKMPDSYGMTIGEVVGIPREVAEPIREHLAQALRDDKVLASATSGNPRAHYLSGVADGRGATAAVDWVLRAPDGSVIHRFEDVGIAQSGSPDFARKVARVFHASLSDGGGAGAGPSAAPTGPVLALGPVEGAPGDGDESLPRALETALAIRGIRVKEDTAESLVVRAEVDIETVREGFQRVDLVWYVVRPDGEIVGTVEQSNEIPAGALDGRWGEIAAAAAEGAADGIVGVLQGLQQQSRAGGETRRGVGGS